MLKKSLVRKAARWLLLPPALFALACALLAPAEAGRATDPATPRRTTPEGQERQKPEPEANSTVRGRVVYDDTSRPARRARLMLVSEGGVRGEYGALTDGRGEFSIRGVRAGTYFAFLDVPGVLSPIAFISVEEMRGGSSGMPDLGAGRAFFDIIEVDGKEDVNVVVHARRGASVAGRVTYADGDPAVNVNISLLRRDAAGRLQRFMTGANIIALSGLRTDDRGMYRLTGLPPGEYVIGVSEPADHSPNGRNYRSDDVSGIFEGMMGQQLLMTFHPSSASVKEAAVIKLAVGDERTDVDVRITERELRTVSGVVRSRRDKRPLARAQVSITRRDDPLGPGGTIAFFGGSESGRNATTTDDEGRWQFDEIPDGPYTINVKPAEEYEPDATAAFSMNSNRAASGVNYAAENRNGEGYVRRRKPGLAPARRDVEVSGGNLTEVVIESGDGGRISGRVTVEGGDASVYAHIALFRLPDGGDERGLASSDYRSADARGGQFSIDGLPAGRFSLQPSIYENDQTVYVKSITWNGKDLLREPLELAEGATAEGVHVVFARNPATLRVTAVRAGDRKPSPYAFASLLATDAPDPSAYNAPRPSCMTSEDGSCPIKAPPGEYLVVVLPRGGLRESFEAEVRRRAATAPRVTLRAGETKELEVIVPEN
jgi:hypothetical protein